MNSPQCPLVFAAALLSVDSPIQSPMLSPLQSPQMNNGSFPDPTSPSILGGKSGNLFVHKLHHMIFDPTYQSLISWSFNGNSFIVCDINLFSSDHNNFSSFVRQLNMYSFTKTNKSPRGSRTPPENQVWEFSHPKFHRDSPNMLDDMKRKANEIGESDRRSSHQTGFAVIALQSQLSQVLSSLQSMQEQFSDVVRELNVVKRKSSIHQLMMMNVLDFLNKNMNPDSETYAELTSIMKATSMDSTKMESSNMGFGMGSLLPREMGDTMSTMEINVSSPQVNSMFSPIVVSPTNVGAPSPFLTQPASPYIAPSQSPYIAPSQFPASSPFQNVMHSPMQNPQIFDSRANFTHFGGGIGAPVRHLSIG